jgi:hypothetical protein
MKLVATQVWPAARAINVNRRRVADRHHAPRWSGPSAASVGAACRLRGQPGQPARGAIDERASGGVVETRSRRCASHLKIGPTGVFGVP